MSYLDHFLFGIYPYIALAIFFFGSLARFEREQYSWKTDSSQLLHTGALRTGNILFHVGILGLFFGHFVGLLTPVAVWDALGVSHGFKQMVAVVMGGIFGTSALIGMLILLARRFGNERIRAVTKPADKLVSLWILVTLLLGLSTIFLSVQHTDGHLMVVLMTWAQHIVTFQGGTGELMAEVPWLFKAHLFMGMTLFVIFPFTRLVHVWSGFASVTYLSRAWQLVRPRNAALRYGHSQRALAKKAAAAPAGAQVKGRPAAPQASYRK
ncbi:respiratory nitrate reductase subunit gamma [Crenobacter sp. HX-7-9]|uniref:nitrate reductase (quinone) n=1 Tax=Crenobacter caeni TaxID=2705474 RepID=A0A6B2KV70_9NEIS|nr:respiratory nitrate reductase subunit gamma [Crenobacter caeni]